MNAAVYKSTHEAKPVFKWKWRDNALCMTNQELNYMYESYVCKME